KGRPRRRRRRRYLAPHRGSLIMALGIISLFTLPLVLGPIAWIMGSNDLEEMRRGRMDPEGESNTNTGRICGMIGTILGGSIRVLGVLFFCVGGCVPGLAGLGGAGRR